jgi:hypothetical protein
MFSAGTADDPMWAGALAALPPPLADVYFTPAYHHLHDDAAQAACWVVEGEGARLLVPGMRAAIAAGGSDLQTPNGYGGPLFDGDPTALEPAWAAWRAAAIREGVVAAFFRLHPLLENHRFLPADATVVDDRETVYIDLTNGPEAVLDSADTRFRNMASKARRTGVEVRWNQADDWVLFEAMYGSAMDRLGASAALRFPPRYFAALRTLPEAELATVAGPDGLEAAAVFLNGSRWSHYHLSARSERAENHLMSAIFDRAIHRLAARGQAGIHLGGGTTPSPDDRLLRFKRSFSPRLLRFSVARVIADVDAFQRLQDAWRASTGHSPGWLLGYRQPQGEP